jgi:glycosyltransferase involved in cell wall biosynthesis
MSNASPERDGLVSAIIPVYNGARYLADAIESVLAQSYRPVELIVVDDGSTDDSATVARRFSDARLILQENRGVAAARNRGVAESRGEFIAFLDQDDRWTPDKLSLQVARLRANPALGYILAHQRVFLEPGLAPPPWLREIHLEGDPVGFLPGTLVIRREVFDKVGEFNEAIRSASDTDWFFRAKTLGVAMEILPETLLIRRIHGANQSREVAHGQAELLKLVRASLAMRRRNGGEKAE